MENRHTPDESIELGLAALELAEFDDAIESFGSAAVEAPDNPKAWFYLGLCYLEKRDVNLAAEALKRAIAADPGYADAHYLLGTAAGAAGQLDEASRRYRTALEIDPGHQKAEEFLIRTEGLLASRQHYRNAMKLIYSESRDPESIDSSVRELLHSVAIFGESPARNEFARLAAEILKAQQTTPIRPPFDQSSPLWTSVIRRGQHAFHRRNWPEASVCYNEALDLSPGHAFIHHLLGLIYFSLGDVDSGIGAWQQTLDCDPDYDFAHIAILVDE